MNCKNTFLVLALGLAATISVGCKTTGSNDLGTSSASRPMATSRIPNVPTAQMPTVNTPTMQGVQTGQQASAMTPVPQSVAQVGYSQINPNTQVTPAGFLRKRAGAQCGGCLSCNSGAGECESPATCGVVETTPFGWNAYGVDPQEFVCDGGDHRSDARLLKNDRLDGLQGEDTVVHYTTESGDIEVQPSNRVCVYSPRFAATRRISQAVEGDRTIALANVDRPIASAGLAMNEGGIALTDMDGPVNAEVTKRIDAIRDRNRGVPIENVLQTETQATVIAVLAAMQWDELNLLQRDQLALLQQANQAAIRWTVSNGVEVATENLKTPTLTRVQEVEGLTVYELPDAGRLRILKMADRDQARPGEIVTFTIRVDNVGDSPVTNVVLTDNLTTRLAYVEDSQKSSCESEFTADSNEEQSLKLQWTLKEPLKVGESATVTFECKLR